MPAPPACASPPESSLTDGAPRGTSLEDGPTALATWGLAIVAALRSRGVDADALLARAGLSVKDLAGPDRRHPLEATTRLWRLAVEVTQDPAFGIEVARHTTFQTFHALGFAVATSATLREALERIVRFFAIVSDAAELRIEDEPAGVRFSAQLRASANPADEAVDALVAVVVRLCRVMHGASFKPLAVQLRRRAPADAEPFARYFGVPVQFGGQVDALLLDRDTTERRLLTANAEIARANDAVAAKYIARLGSARVAERVRQAIAEHLPQGEPDPAVVARRLGVSVRTLQRKLADERTTFVALRDEVRERLARVHLEADHYSVGEITYLLGFSGVSSFSHAFRRWTGQSPSAYRQKNTSKVRQGR